MGSDSRRLVPAFQRSRRTAYFVNEWLTGNHLGYHGRGGAAMRPRLPRISLAPLPTPVEFLPRLTRALGGAKVFVKRDDLTGLAGGGNKARKLELLVGDALARGADTLVTLGSAQSNHCRQTAAAAARCGLRAILVLGGAP